MDFNLKYSDSSESSAVRARMGSTRGSDEFKRAQFAQTRWTLIQKVMSDNQVEIEKALSEIVVLYWEPLYAFARRKGRDRDDAADSTQAFFVYLLEKNVLHSADKQKGRLRTFLLTVFQRFLSGELVKAGSWRRGGRNLHLSFDVNQAEDYLSSDSVSQLSPEALYERKWALAVMNQAISRLAKDRNERGKGAIFEALRPYLSEDAPANQGELKDIANKLGLEETTIRVHLHRLRRLFREHLLDVISETLQTSDEAAIRDELEALCHALT